MATARARRDRGERGASGHARGLAGLRRRAGRGGGAGGRSACAGAATGGGARPPARRPALRPGRPGRRAAWPSAAMEHALVTHDFSSSTWPRTTPGHPAALLDHRPVVGPGRLDPAVGPGPRRLRHACSSGATGVRPADPVVAVGHPRHVRRGGLLLRAHGRARPTPSSRCPGRAPSRVPGPTPCSRTTRSWPSTRRCSTWASSGSRCPSPSPSACWPPAGSASAGRSRPGAGRSSSWTFLSVGIVLGAWWSYQVLGWGGFWGWDPVENAALMPWLCGTAYLHSVLVQERRGLLRVWNLSLCRRHLLPHHPRHLPHPLGGHRVGARLLRVDPRAAPDRLLPPRRGGRASASSPGGATGCARPGASTPRSAGRARSCVNNLLFVGFAFVVLLGTLFPLLYQAAREPAGDGGRPVLQHRRRPASAWPCSFLMAVAPAPQLAQGRRGGAVAPPGRPGLDRGADRRGLRGRRGAGPRPAARLRAGRLRRRLGRSRSLVLSVRASRRHGAGRVAAGWSGRTNGGMVVHLGVVVLAVGLVAATSFRPAQRAGAAPGPDRCASTGTPSCSTGCAPCAPPQRPGHRGRGRRSTAGGPFLPGRQPVRRAGSPQPVGTPAIDSGFLGDVYLTFDAIGGTRPRLGRPGLPQPAGRVDRRRGGGRAAARLDVGRRPAGRPRRAAGAACPGAAAARPTRSRPAGRGAATAARAPAAAGRPGPGGPRPAAAPARVPGRCPRPSRSGPRPSERHGAGARRRPRPPAPRPGRRTPARWVAAGPGGGARGGGGGRRHPPELPGHPGAEPARGSARPGVRRARRSPASRSRWPSTGAATSS